MTFLPLSAVLLSTILGAGSDVEPEDWPQWGGPRRDFTSRSGGLAEAWPEGGPRKLWARDLGEGYSSILAEGDRLFTLYSRGEVEVAAALDASSGKAVWERRWDAPLLPGMALENGAGPHSTPLLAGDRLFAIGVTGRLHCLSKDRGEVLWSKRLLEDLKGSVLGRGYSSSPLGYRDLLIVPVGGPGQGMAAFDQRDGSLRWKSQDFRISHSSPILLRAGGRDVVAGIVDKAIVGLDAEKGDLLFSVPQPTIGDHIASLPVWDGERMLFVSCAYDGGSRGVELTAKDGQDGKDGQLAAAELWFTSAMRLHHSNALRIGRRVYGSSGDFGPSTYNAIDLDTGKVAWRSREVARSSGLLVDGKLILLEEDGRLNLARAGAEGLEVLSRAKALEGRSWTPPTIRGKTLYLRNRKVIAALELP